MGKGSYNPDNEFTQYSAEGSMGPNPSLTPSSSGMVPKPKSTNGLPPEVLQKYDYMATAPKYPGYVSLLNGEGALPGQYQSNPESRIDPTAMDAFRGRALAEGTSPWAMSMLNKNNIQLTDDLQVGSATAASGAAQARSNLAMKGGLDSGSRERIARGGMIDRMTGQQTARRNAEVSKWDILTNDDKQKMSMLGQLPGMEDSRNQMVTQAEQFNIGNTLKERGNSEAAKMAEYQEKMKAWAANRQAEATENSGK